MTSFGMNRDIDSRGSSAHDHHREPPPARFTLPSSSDFELPGSRRLASKTAHPGLGRPISPPPLRRNPSGITGRTDVSPTRASDWALPNTSVASYRAQPFGDRMGDDGSSQQAAPGPSETNSTSRVYPPPRPWTVTAVADRLTTLRQDIRNGHAQLAAFMIESTHATERRVHQGKDLFANIAPPQVAEQGADTVKIKFKQHLKVKKDQPLVYYKPICIKTTKERVPPYRFHHVEIKKSVLTPNTMLTFVPHLRDLDKPEEKKYNLWLKELEEFDRKSGFTPMKSHEKSIHIAQSERARTVSLYLESWLEDLAIPGCTKSTLISYMARQEPDNAITPQQKTDIIASHNKDAVPGANAAAGMFTEAFKQVFTHEDLPEAKQIFLRHVLVLEESVDDIMDSKPTAKDGSNPEIEDEYGLIEAKLATYCLLGCLICFSHSCEHGEYDNQNCKGTFSISSSGCRLGDILERRQLESASLSNGVSAPPCRRKCHRSIMSYDLDTESRPFSEQEIVVIRSLFATADHSKVKRDSICLAADFLNRDCCAVYHEFEKLNIALPTPQAAPNEMPRVKNLPWYDRYKKALIGDWQDHTITHEYQRRELVEPCCHDGPCAPKICSCVDAGILCEKFCGCSVKSCAYKFTGCACHSHGKNCQRKHNDNNKSSCICIQLNRECDPALCGTCGAYERADPVNAGDDALHSTGCQNCVLQRGSSKALLLGKSQLEGVGYGLFTAQDIAQDDFVIEYVGELIFHDEGVRREARRGDVFDEESTSSYLFTLLENEGIWVDAAIYGNLSRYINHASENEKRGCNMTPRILYVNGEFRIKFTALRDIKAGEELFFNYGDEFPNLTKKLLDEKVGETAELTKTKRKPASHAVRDGRVARKAPKAEMKPRKKPRGSRKDAVADLDDDVAMGNTSGPRKTRKRKRNLRDSSEEDEYEPVGTDTQITGSGIESEEPSPGTIHRLRARAKAKANMPRTPTKAGDTPKPKGKRGGARPGSGRPRKHPRPAPKPDAVSEPTPGTVGPTPAPVPVPIPVPAVAAAAAATTSPVRSSPRQQQPSRLRSAHTVDEIADSDDGGPAGEEDDEDEDDEDDEDDDQDVMVRRRVSRNRRRPAKFRDEGLWG